MDETIDQPILFIILMIRQKAYVDSEGKGFTLLQQEELKNNKLSWEEQLRLNREKLKKQMAKM